MICAIHQPNYIPYLGFFDKYKKADIFVLYDTAQYSKNDFHNRNKIKYEKGWKWITIPVHVYLGQKIKDVEIADKNILEKHLDIIKLAYQKAENFEESFEFILKLFNSLKGKRFLVEINIPILMSLFKMVDNSKKIVLASELQIKSDLKKTSALVEICKKVGADKYLSGIGAKDYLDEKEFYKENIEVIWQNFHHPIYVQLYGDFIPNLSIIDALMNVGIKRLKEILK